MKKTFLVLAMVMVGFFVMRPVNAAAYNFGDMRSETLTAKAWEALKQGDTEAVLAYVNKCVELYGEKAQKMQASLTAYPDPAKSKDEVFSYWALNDVATSLFIQGEAYRQAKMNDEAKQAYSKVVNEYSYGQTWDTKGWFWKPAEAAKEKIAAIESGSNLDFGDYSSSFLTTQAWKAKTAKDKNAVIAYVDKVVELYGAKAKEMQASLKEYPFSETPEAKEKVFSFWALNDVGTALFVKGETLKDAGDVEAAKIAYKELVDDFSFAQCYDPSWQGFWKPSQKAQEALDDMGPAS